MRWLKILCLALWILTGCGYTVSVEPPKKPSKYVRHTRHHSERKPSPSPTATPRNGVPNPNHPIWLEPTSKPTPMIKLPPQDLTVLRRIHPMDMYL